MANKRNSKCKDCNNNAAEQNNNYLPDPCPGCEDDVAAECVVYTGEDTVCLDIKKGTRLDDIIKGLDQVICLLAEGGDYSDYDFGCLDNLGIQSEQQFVETIVSILCEILGDQTPGNITSLTELYNLIQTLGNPKFTYSECAEPLVNLPANSTLPTVLAALRNAICAHKAIINNLQTKVDSLESRVTIVEDNITDINTTLGDHETRITNLENAPDDNSDELVKVSPNDTTPGYLLSKIDTAGSNITVTEVNDGQNEKIRLNVTIPTVVDEKVKVWSGDTSGFLEGKIDSVNTTGIDLITVRVGNQLIVTPQLLFDTIAQQVLNLFITNGVLNTQFCQAVSACIGVAVPCAPPGEIGVTESGNDSITVQWTAVPTNLQGYILEYKKTTDVAYTTITLPPTASIYTITGLVPGTDYNIRVKTDCGVTESNYVTTTGSTTCPIPTNLNVTFS